MMEKKRLTTTIIAVCCGVLLLPTIVVGIFVLGYSGYINRLFINTRTFSVAPAKTAVPSQEEFYFAYTAYPAEGDINYVAHLSCLAENKTENLLDITYSRSNDENITTEPRLILKEDQLLVYFDGRQYIDSGATEEVDDGYIRWIVGFDPHVLLYSPESGEYSEVKLPKKHITILDAFVYENKYYLLVDEYTVWRSWGIEVGSVLYLYEIDENRKVARTKLGDGAVGSWPLSIKGSLVDNAYYYPTATGINKLEMQSINNSKLVDLDFTKSTFVSVQKLDDRILVASQVAQYTRPDLYPDDKCIVVQQYDEAYQALGEMTLMNAALGAVYMEKDQLLISYTPESVVFEPSNAKYLVVDAKTLEAHEVQATGIPVTWKYCDEEWLAVYE